MATGALSCSQPEVMGRSVDCFFLWQQRQPCGAVLRGWEVCRFRLRSRGEMRAVHGDSFEDYVYESGTQLKRLAYLLTGDVFEAEDLLQSAYAKVLPHWHKVQHYDLPDVYLRRVMVSIRTSWWRRSKNREFLVDEVPERVSSTTALSDSVVDSQILLAALEKLPARQRAAVVLRHWCDLSEAETAASMGCSVGTVKSNTSKGLAHLRVAMAEPVLAGRGD